MLTLTEPSEREIEDFLASDSNLPFSYAEVGATQGQCPLGYNVDHNRIELGKGRDVYDGAVAALTQWRQFDLGWVSIAPRGAKIESGTTVAVKARAAGLWSLNACRVVYVVDETEAVGGDAASSGSADKSIHRFGFAYGTLPDHIERGEERFLIEWNRSDDSVWYDILAFSQPRHPLVKIGAPLARVMQKRFARDSLAAMKAAVSVTTAA